MKIRKGDFMNLLEVKKLNVTLNEKKIIRDINFSIKKGETIVIIGPNGSGKTTIAKALTGFPGLEVEGEAKFKGENLLSMNPSKRSKEGLFMSFQNPVEIQGVSISNFIRTAINSRRKKEEKINIKEYIQELNETMNLLGIPKEFSRRELNHGFSGGEKKKAEMLQLMMLKPDLAILDETDSGLDIDALKNVCENINLLKQKNKELGLIIITHYKRMLDYLDVNRVIVIKEGRIIKEGGTELIHLIEEKGFEDIK